MTYIKTSFIGDSSFQVYLNTKSMFMLVFKASIINF